MNWKPFFKPRETTMNDSRGKTKEKDIARSWLDQVIVRQVTQADLPGMEWDGEYAHFRRVYAEAYQRMQRGYTVLWVADLPGTGLIGHGRRFSAGQAHKSN